MNLYLCVLRRGRALLKWMDDSAAGAIFWRDAGINSARDSHSAICTVKTLCTVKKKKVEPTYIFRATSFSRLLSSLNLFLQEILIFMLYKLKTTSWEN